MKIHVLPSEISDQIAAGEVVENPCSVIKELIENSLDAGASEIKIYINDGGKKLIKIEDNGYGMSETDAKLSIKRHATSKISQISDLFAVQSFGFRGEALAAISSVSRFTLKTKTEKADFGTQLFIEGGKNLEISQIGMNQGTSIEICDLFFSVPARLQYLKNSETEYRNILKEVKAFALANPQVSFTIFKDNKKSFDYVAVDSFKARIGQVLARISNDLVAISYQDSTLKISGFISRPEKCVAHKNQQFLFVNGRKIDDYKLTYAIREAYNKSCGIEKHLNPLFVIFIEIEPLLVDVNVHPRKLEVKFTDPADVFRGMQMACFEALEIASSIPNNATASLGNISNNSQNSEPILNKRSINSNLSNNFSNFKITKNQAGASNNFSQNLQKSCELNFDSNGFSSKNKERDLFLNLNSKNSQNLDINNIDSDNFSENLVENKINENSELGELKLIGQAGRKYILAENEAGLFIFDQHALHERQRFEQYWDEYFNAKIQGQKLLIPQILDFSEEIIILFNEHKNLIKNIGFEINFPEDDQLEVLTIPNILDKEDLKMFFESLIEYFENDQIGEHALDKILRRLLEFKACRGAVMYGDSLSTEDMQKILEDLKHTKFKWLCAHGRPSYLFQPFDEIDRGFHR